MIELNRPEIGSHWIGRKDKSEVEVISVHPFEYEPIRGTVLVRVIRDEYSPASVGKTLRHMYSASGKLYGRILKEAQ